jgi:hypothetical protein
VNLRTLSAAAAALALAIVPAAHAKQAKHELPEGMHVCNTASQNWQGGDLEVSPADPQGAHRYKDKLRKHHNVNKNAAMHSQALALCGSGDEGTTGGNGDPVDPVDPVDPTDGGDDDGGTTGGDGEPVETLPGYGV